MAALGVSNGIAPPYTATVIVELLQESHSGKFFVRVLYRNESNGEPFYNLTIPGNEVLAVTSCTYSFDGHMSLSLLILVTVYVNKGSYYDPLFT